VAKNTKQSQIPILVFPGPSVLGALDSCVPGFSVTYAKQSQFLHFQPKKQGLPKKRTQIVIPNGCELAPLVWGGPMDQTSSNENYKAKPILT